MKMKNQKNGIKGESGSVAALVLVTVIAFIIILTAFYFRSTHVRESQLETDALLKGIYESQVNDELHRYTTKNYVQKGLQLQYDGIDNTKEGHDGNATEWEDVSGNGHNATLNGIDYLEESGWKEKCLKMDGIDDWIDTNIAGNAITADTSLTLSMVVEFNTIRRSGVSYGETESENDIGTLFGAVNNGGYGLIWKTQGSGDIEGGIFAMAQTPSNREITGTQIVAGKKISVVQVLSQTEGKNKLYVNGTLVASSDYTTGEEWENVEELGNIVINGGDNAAYGAFRPAFADINLYDVLLYNRALTEDEIAQNYKVDRYRFEI